MIIEYRFKEQKPSAKLTKKIEAKRERRREKTNKKEGETNRFTLFGLTLGCKASPHQSINGFTKQIRTLKELQRRICRTLLPKVKTKRHNTCIYSQKQVVYQKGNLIGLRNPKKVHPSGIFREQPKKPICQTRPDGTKSCPGGIPSEPKSRRISTLMCRAITI